MISINSLLDGHDRIVRAAERLLEQVGIGEAPRPTRTAALLQSLAATVGAHVHEEDGFIYAVEREGLSPEEAQSRFAAEFVALREDWTDYLDRWPSDRLPADWPGFAAATREMIPRMLARVEQENAFLYPQALRLNIVSLR